MLEVFIVIQTLVIIAIFIVFLLMFMGFKKESEVFKEKLSKLESDIQPVLIETKNLLSNINYIAGSVKEITDDIKLVSNKVKESVSTVQNMIDSVKKTFGGTKTKMSVFRIGIQAGASTLLGHYLKKLQKKEE